MKPPRRSLDPNRPVRTQHCVTCGQPFPTQYGIAQYCSGRCQIKAWRAVAMLAGTHGYVAGRFVRLMTEAR
jgi:hypothetical protein